MNYDFLKYFITEPVYLVEADESVYEVKNQAPPESQKSDRDPVQEVLSQTELKPIEEKDLHVLVIVKYTYVKTLPENEKKLLSKILESVGLTSSDITLLNIAFDPVPENDKLLKYSTILVFDYLLDILSMLGASKDLYTKQTFKNQTCVIADPLESIDADIKKKKQLWDVLKSVFQI